MLSKDTGNERLISREFLELVSSSPAIKFNSPDIVEYITDNPLRPVITDLVSFILGSPKDEVLCSQTMNLSSESCNVLKKLVETNQVISYSLREEASFAYYWNDIANIQYQSDIGHFWNNISLPNSKENLISQMESLHLHPFGSQKQLTAPLEHNTTTKSRKKLIKKSSVTNSHLPNLFNTNTPNIK